MTVNDKKEILPKHNINLQNRSKLIADGINEVISFDENLIQLDTRQGKLTLKGTNLKIDKLSLENSELELSGQVNSLVYDMNYKKRSKSLLQTLFR